MGGMRGMGEWELVLPPFQEMVLEIQAKNAIE